jgi:DNA-binding transcriptional ArsR family regulator
MSNWTFLTNHGMVLSQIAKHPRITALEVSSAIGITERATRKIIAELLEAGYITIKKEGRRNRYRIIPDLLLRHPAHGETAVGDLLKALGWKKRGRPSFENA